MDLGHKLLVFLRLALHQGLVLTFEHSYFFFQFINLLHGVLSLKLSHFIEFIVGYTDEGIVEVSPGQKFILLQLKSINSVSEELIFLFHLNQDQLLFLVISSSLVQLKFEKVRLLLQHLELVGHLLDHVLQLFNLIGTHQLVRVFGHELLKFQDTLLLLLVTTHEVIVLLLKTVEGILQLVIVLKGGDLLLLLSDLLSHLRNCLCVLLSFFIKLLFVISDLLFLELNLGLKLASVENTSKVKLPLLEVGIFLGNHVFVKLELLYLVSQFLVDSDLLLVLVSQLVRFIFHLEKLIHQEFSLLIVSLA